MASTHDYKIDPRNNDIKIYINGEFYHRSKAFVSVLDSGFLLGDGVWEGIRLHNNYLVHLDSHLNRLISGAKEIGINIGLTKKEIKKAIRKTLLKNKMESNVHIRLIVSRGIKKTPYQHPSFTISAPTIVIIPEYKKADPNIKKNGIRIAKVETKRDHRVQNPRVNSLSKHNCIAACIEADKLGVDEGLMLDPNDNVSTCNSTNFFIVRDKEVWTSMGKYCLNGVTRESIIRLCKENKIPVFEKNFKINKVHSSDEVFVTGTFAGVIPVVEVDNITIGNGSRGIITKKLQKFYKTDIEKLSIVK
ncbi:MAG: aminotransferase class IV [Candidatus Marinimicrobia bacterium]|nr:aminotransferase class IV [Candidatus Neomarinimicrobiota bacterium]|tara:strand:- start:2592 stop:3503 length:912 start_codon:yes stop_codon:yes gene_type:complete